MNLTINIKKDNLIDFLAISLLSIFLVSKMIRSFSGSDVAGGIWNYIQIIIVVLGFGIPIIKKNVLIEFRSVAYLILFSIISMLTSVQTLQFTQSGIFSFITIGYASSLLFVFYYIGKNNEIESNIFFHIVFYIISAIFIYSMLSAKKFSTEIGAVSDVYYILGLLPLELIYSKKLPVVPIIVCGVAVLISGKRAGLIAFVLMIMVYYFIKGIENKRLSDFLKYAFIFIAVAVILFIVLQKTVSVYNANFWIRLTRLSEDGGSGRLERWKYVCGLIFDSDIFSIFFGHGKNALVRSYYRAHNDFLEIMYDFGLFALIIYLSFYVDIIVQIVKMVKDKYEYASITIISFILALVLSMVSFYAVEPTYITCGMISFGYLLADYQKKKECGLSYEN